MANLLQWKEGGVVVVDQAAHHTAIREGRGEVGHLVVGRREKREGGRRNEEGTEECGM